MDITVIFARNLGNIPLNATEAAKDLSGYI
jgi:hypothetical protein